ncbi:hypothetical protein P8452_74156 [Trifolium repens]|nr:hypothetical protein P8452_74156 [Trifolium repens]
MSSLMQCLCNLLIWTWMINCLLTPCDNAESNCLIHKPNPTYLSAIDSLSCSLRGVILSRCPESGGGGVFGAVRGLEVVLFPATVVVVLFSVSGDGGGSIFCFWRQWWWFLSASFRLVFVFTIEVKLHNSVAGTYGLPPTPARRALFIVCQSAILYIAKRISSRIASWGIILAGYGYAEFMFQFVVKLWRVYLVLLFVCEHKFRYHGNNHV